MTAAGWTGQEARALRLARRMSVRAFAAHLGVTTATVSNWDSRGRLARLRTETQELLDTDLARAPYEVRERFLALTRPEPGNAPPPTTGSSPDTLSPLVADELLSAVPPAVDSVEQPRLPDVIRKAILTAGPGDDGRAETSLAQLRSLADHAHLTYQQADYRRALAAVPGLMAATSTTPIESRGQTRQAAMVSAEAHLAVSKLALKFGDAQLAWIAGERARCHAIVAGVPALRILALFSIGCAVLALPDRRHEAPDLVEHALSGSTTSRLRGPADVSAAGAVTLLAAIVAARHNNHRQAAAYLRNAGALAERLGGDRNDLWTAFGPTNVLIHRVGITATTDPDAAIALGERLDTSRLHAALVSRRSQVHLDLATAFSHRPRGDASAVLHLLQAEQLAPQLFRIHPPAQALIRRLLGRERRALTPGLRDLAARAGVVAP